MYWSVVQGVAVIRMSLLRTLAIFRMCGASPTRRKGRPRQVQQLDYQMLGLKSVVSKEGEHREKEETWAREVHYLTVIKTKANHNETTRNPH